MGHLVVKLGRVMELRDHPLGVLFRGGPVCPVKVLTEERALHWGSEEESLLNPEVEGRTPGASAHARLSTVPCPAPHSV